MAVIVQTRTWNESNLGSVSPVQRLEIGRDLSNARSIVASVSCKGFRPAERTSRQDINGDCYHCNAMLSTFWHSVPFVSEQSIIAFKSRLRPVNSTQLSNSLWLFRMFTIDQWISEICMQHVIDVIVVACSSCELKQIPIKGDLRTENVRRRSDDTRTSTVHPLSARGRCGRPRPNYRDGWAEVHWTQMEETIE